MLTENHLEVGTMKAKSYPHKKSSSLWILKWEVRAECLLWLYIAIAGNGCNEERGNSRVRAMGLLEMQVRTTGILPLPRVSGCCMWCFSVWLAMGKTVQEIMQVFLILLTCRLPKNTAKTRWIQETFSTDLCKRCIRVIFGQKFFVIMIFWPRE